MRKVVLRIHLILSLVLGLFIVTTCTTGSLIIVEPEVESWMYPIGQSPTPSDMMPLFLMITGIVIWQLKARGRKRNKKQQTAATAAA
ncbi:PepSY domain-containing protein [Paenibacillus sp. P36]|uniref:PepSY domain-containing protein n=1 Tax=Paenibacillus sp. P36 TaxID=3342538 RepID=UPI0038B374DD